MDRGDPARHLGGGDLPPVPRDVGVELPARPTGAETRFRAVADQPGRRSPARHPGNRASERRVYAAHAQPFAADPRWQQTSPPPSPCSAPPDLPDPGGRSARCPGSTFECRHRRHDRPGVPRSHPQPRPVASRKALGTGARMGAPGADTPMNRKRTSSPGLPASAAPTRWRNTAPGSMPMASPSTRCQAARTYLPPLDPRAPVGPPRDRGPVRADVTASDRGARGLYDSYLRANRIEEGIANYAVVLRLMLGTTIRGGLETSPFLRFQAGPASDGRVRSRSCYSPGGGVALPRVATTGVVAVLISARHGGGDGVGESGGPALHDRRQAGHQADAAWRRPSATSVPTAGALRPPRSSRRIRALVIPPAWTDVWICSDAARPPAGDRARCARAEAVPLSPEVARGPRRNEVRPHDRLRPGAAADPPAAPTAICGRPALPREKVLAAVVQLLEKTLIRVGNDEYAKQQPLVRPDDAARRARRGQRRTACGSRSAARAASSTRSISNDRRLARIVKAVPRPSRLRAVSVRTTSRASGRRSGRPT